MPALVDATPKSLTTNEALQSHPIRPKYDNLPVLNKGVFDKGVFAAAGNSGIDVDRSLQYASQAPKSPIGYPRRNTGWSGVDSLALYL